MWRKSDSHLKCLAERTNWNKQTLCCSLMQMEYTETTWITCCSSMQPEPWPRRNRWRMPKGHKIASSLSAAADTAAATQHICWSRRPRNSLPRKKPRLQSYGGRKPLRSSLNSKLCCATCGCRLPAWFFCLIMVTRWHKNLSRMP